MKATFPEYGHLVDCGISLFWSRNFSASTATQGLRLPSGHPRPAYAVERVHPWGCTIGWPARASALSTSSGFRA